MWGVATGQGREPPSTGQGLRRWPGSENTGHTESAEQRSADRDIRSDCGGVNLKSMPGSGLRGRGSCLRVRLPQPGRPQGVR